MMIEILFLPFVNMRKDTAYIVMNTLYRHGDKQAVIGLPV